jgi:cell wall-associated NlpC family hydrolase
MSSQPLAPHKGAKRITSAQLAPGDLIVSTTNAIWSQVIRQWTHSKISHVMLYLGHGQVVEAIPDGVVVRSLTAALHDATLAVAFRKKGLSHKVIQNVLAYARTKAAEKRAYDYRGAAGGGARANPTACRALLGTAMRPIAELACRSAARGGWQDPEKYYCSELVLESFERAGVRLVDTSPSVSVPQQIVDAAQQGVLAYVGHLR